MSVVAGEHSVASDVKRTALPSQTTPATFALLGDSQPRKVHPVPPHEVSRGRRRSGPLVEVSTTRVFHAASGQAGRSGTPDPGRRPRIQQGWWPGAGQPLPGVAAIQAYGIHGVDLRIDGDLPVGSLAAVPGAPRITVRVRQAPPWGHGALDPARTLYASAPDEPDRALHDVGWTADGSGLRLRYVEGATFWIARDLDEIWMTWEAPLTATDAAHFLLEPVLAFVLRRRGMLVMHASAADVSGQAIVICGPRGAGKSSLAAALVAGGASLLSDDVVALGMAGDHWWAQRGTGALRLWDDGVSAFTADVESVPRFSDTWGKRVMAPVRLGGRDAMGPAAVGLLCVLVERLGADDAAALEPVTGHAAFREVVAHTAANFLHDNERRSEELAQLARLLSDVPVVRVRAPDSTARVHDTASTIVRHLRA